MAKFRYVITLFLMSLGTVSAWQTEVQAEDKLPVVATFSILADFARNVGGGRIVVTELVGPNGDTHVYQPSPADAQELAAARLILVNGLGLEGWIDRLIKASGAKASVAVATKGIKPQQINEEGRIGIDPHAWQSIANAKIYVVNIREALIAADPEGALDYRANAEKYLSELDALDKEVTAEIAAIPPARRQIITTHDAFGYFGTAYGFRFVASRGHLDGNRGKRP